MEAQKEDQLIWVFGVLERLCNLGMIGGFGYHITDPDKFLEIDERRHTLFPDDRLMAQLVAIICRRECGMTDTGDIGGMMHLVKSYRDNRDTLVKVALEHMLSGGS